MSGLFSLKIFKVPDAAEGNAFKSSSKYPKSAKTGAETELTEIDTSSELNRLEYKKVLLKYFMHGQKILEIVS